MRALFWVSHPATHAQRLGLSIIIISPGLESSPGLIMTMDTPLTIEDYLRAMTRDAP